VAREAQAVRRFFNIAPSSEATQLQDRPPWATDGAPISSTASTVPMPSIPAWMGTGALGPPPKAAEPATDRHLPPQLPALPETIKVSPAELRAQVAAVKAPPVASSSTIRDQAPVPSRSRKSLLVALGLITTLAVVLTVIAVVSRHQPGWWVLPQPSAAAKAQIEVAPPPPPKAAPVETPVVPVETKAAVPARATKKGK
jgi:hypothetical protein